jgi:hypothetical protein
MATLSLELWFPSRRGCRRLDTVLPMDTQKQFLAQRLKAHAAATVDVDKDPLIQAALADLRGESVKVSEWERTAYVFSPGWQTRRQAD